MILGPAARVALYYVPAPDDTLMQAATSWYADHAAITGDARSYGFHATLKPPMRLRADCGWQDVRDAAETIAATVPPFALPPLAVADIDGFLALRETAPCPALHAFADACVAGADHLRAPPDAEEQARRRRIAHTPAEAANVTRWGYPYVFATWFFHMTLTRRLDADEQAVVRPAAAAHFAAALSETRRVTALCVCVQAAPGEGFAVAERVTLRG